MAIAYPILSSPSVPWRCALAAGSDDTDAHRTSPKTETDRRRTYVTAIIKRVFFRFTRAEIFARNSKTARSIFATGRSWAAYRARLPPLRSTGVRGPFTRPPVFRAITYVPPGTRAAIWPSGGPTRTLAAAGIVSPSFQ